MSGGGQGGPYAERMTTTSPPQPGELSLPARPGWPDETGHFGIFGGRFVPEALIAALDELTEAYEAMRVDPAFLAEFDRLQRDYTGRPSPLTEVPKFAEHAGGARVLLKREDLNHTGSHKINNVLGQALLTKRIGKTRVIAETGAGQHGVATATAARADRARLHRLHGRGGHPPPGAQRGPDAAARRRGHPGHHRLAHAQGRDQRGLPRLGDQRRDDALRLRHRRRPAPLPGDGPRLPAGDRRRGPRPGARAGRAGCPTRSWPASAAAPTRSASSPPSSPTRACG